MKELFLKFLESPDRASYLAVRGALMSSGSYDPYSSDVIVLDQLIAAGELDDARERISGAMGDLLLSPSAHLMLSWIAAKTADERTARLERVIAAACCEGILATGDGTREGPYLVTRVSDEYDLLGYLDKRLKSQSLVEDEGRCYDFLTCEDGSEIWFDITDFYSRL